MQEKGEKSAREVERLRAHLLQIEDSYTQEAIAAEEREKDLRNRLASCEEKILSSSNAVQSARLTNYEWMSNSAILIFGISFLHGGAMILCLMSVKI